MKSIAVFCGAKMGNRNEYTSAAKTLAASLVKANITLIYGGTSVGLMGIIADEMIKHSGKVIGVIPDMLVDIEIAHTNLDELHIVKNMAERKELMMSLADGFVMLPGGAGSLDEFFEVVTLGYLKQHHKPIGMLNIENYYQHLIQFMQHAVDEGFFNSTTHQHIIIENNSDVLIKRCIDFFWAVTSRPESGLMTG